MRSAVAAREPSAERKMFLLSLTPGLRRGYVHSVPSGLGQFTFKGSWLEKEKRLRALPRMRSVARVASKTPCGTAKAVP